MIIIKWKEPSDVKSGFFVTLGVLFYIGILGAFSFIPAWVFYVYIVLVMILIKLSYISISFRPTPSKDEESK